MIPTTPPQQYYTADGIELVPDCTIPETPVQENWAECRLVVCDTKYLGEYNITGTPRRQDLPGIPGFGGRNENIYVIPPEI